MDLSTKAKVELPITNAEGNLQGTLLVSLLRPSEPQYHGPAPLIDLRNDPDRDTSLEPVQLLEGEEYFYEINVDRSEIGELITDKPEIFNPNPKGNQGRLRPGSYTGSLLVKIFAGEKELGLVSLEVRSRKLDYLRHYRWMLQNIAEGFSEVIMERFAPTEQRFATDQYQDAKTLYQRFAFLKSLISGEIFEAAMRQILARPHRIWVEEEEFRRPGQSIRADSRLARQLSKPGPRFAWQEGQFRLGVDSLPSQLTVARREESLDTPENRFIKFALSLWRSVISEIGQALEREIKSQPVKRGLQEIKEAKDQIDVFLSHQLFREVGRLTQFPASSQVLQKKEGYRDLFRNYIQSEVAALLTWQGGEEVYGAGQRDVATLYEFWVFLQLANIVSNLCQESFNSVDLLEISKDGLNINLRRGESKVLSGTVSRLGRRLRLEFWFNRTFGPNSQPRMSWTRPMRPDCSLLILPDEECMASFERVWLHFDAKYRVENLEGLFGKKVVSLEEEAKIFEEEEVAEARGRAKRSDLLKMHTYRDAIHRTAGAYVIYPGDKPEELTEYHELLPGLGAFVLFPTETGDALGTASLTQFIEKVLRHIASQITQHERWRYWTKEAFNERYRVEEHGQAVPFLLRPPADTLVLLGYVKSHQHLHWIHDNKQYNLRADKRRGSVGLRSVELAADFILLYGQGINEIELWRVSDEPEIKTKLKMSEMAYPEPKGELYFCLPIERIEPSNYLPQISKDKIAEVLKRIAPNAIPGKPVTTTWLEIIK